MKKSCFNDPKTCYIMQLAQLPNVSEIIAKSICEKYPTMMDLCQEISCNGSESLALLVIGNSKSSKGTSKKLGKKIAENICKYLLQENE